MTWGTLRLSRRVHRLQRIADETLRTPERARNIEATIEAAEILRGLEGLLERGLRETQRGPKPLELTRVDLRHRQEVSGFDAGTRLTRRVSGRA